MSHVNAPSVCAPDRSFREAGAERLYAPLDSSIESIRLVRILPSLNSDLVECEIVVATTADSYVCLSYCWGEPSEQLIRLNGASVAVRENLDDFLKEARRRQLSEWLWIDALCIDQSNVAERNHQVKQMAMIYRSARSVIVWLGIDVAYLHGRIEDTSDYDAFVTTMASKQAPTTSPLTVERLQARWPRGTLLHNDGRLFIDNLQLFYLCKNPYWSRIWILQEFLLARRLIIWWGRVYFPAEGVLAAVMRNYVECKQVLDDCKADIDMEMRFRDLLYVPVSRDRYVVEESLQILEQVHRLTKFRQVLESKGALPAFCDTIEALKPSLCTDSRDRVYALLSLASDAAGFDVDYKEDLVHLYLRLLQYSKTKEPWPLPDRKVRSISLARCLGVDAESLCHSIFERREAVQQHWNATFQSRIADPGIECEVWALYPPVSCPPPGLVAQAVHTLRENLTGKIEICISCLKYANSLELDDSLIMDFGAPEVWLQMNAGSYSPSGRPIIRALQHHSGTFFEADRAQRRLRLVFEDDPTPSTARWILVVKRGELRLAAVLPHCVSANCVLSGRAWQSTQDKQLQTVTTWTVTPTPRDSDGPKFGEYLRRGAETSDPVIGKVLWFVTIVVIGPPFAVVWAFSWVLAGMANFAVRVARQCAASARKKRKEWQAKRPPPRKPIKSKGRPLDRPFNTVGSKQLFLDPNEICTIHDFLRDHDPHSQASKTASSIPSTFQPSTSDVLTV